MIRHMALQSAALSGGALHLCSRHELNNTIESTGSGRVSTERTMSIVLDVMDCKDPEQISLALGVEPTSQYRRGSRSQHPVVLPKRNAWHHRVNYESGQEFENRFPIFLDQFEPVRTELVAISRDCEVKITIIIEDQVCFLLPPELMNFCTELRIPLLIDRY